MADPTVPQVVRSYLAQLERALAGLPVDVRDEIVAGIREELDGLDAAAAAARIEALGDPEFIAAEARAEAAEPAGGSPLVERVETSGREPRWYPVLAALLVAFGAVVVPVIGWVVGIAMVCLSRTWTRGEKWAATLTPFVAIAVATALATTPSLLASGRGATTTLFFAPFDLVWSGAVLFVLSNVVVGIWLLWRAKQSGSTEVPQPQAG